MKVSKDSDGHIWYTFKIPGWTRDLRISADVGWMTGKAEGFSLRTNRVDPSHPEVFYGGVLDKADAYMLAMIIFNGLNEGQDV